MVSHLGAGLFAKPGLGKTSMSLAAGKILLETKKIKRIVVVAPLLITYGVWPAEIKKWSNFSHLRHVVLHGPKKDEALYTEADVYLINHEGLEWLHDNWPKEWDKDDIMFIADESTRFKHHDTLRFKIMRGGRVVRKEGGAVVRKKFDSLVRKFKYRVILTGTPETKQYLGMWSQMYLVDEGERLGRFISHYRNEYYTPDIFGYDWVLIPGAKEKIQKKISDVVLYIDDEEHLDLPPIVGDVIGVSKESSPVEPIYLDLPAKTMSVYKQMEALLIAQLESGDVVTAQNAAVATTKLRQIANGGLYLNATLEEMEDYGAMERRKTQHLHMVKAEATQSIVEELNGDPALITYEYHHDLERLLRVLGKSTPYIGHGVPAKNIAKTLEAWDAGDLPALLIQPQAAHGLNMQYGGRALIFHSLFWSYEDYYQLIKRLWRQGQKERVYLYHLATRGTVDEAVLGSLRSGADTDRDFMNCLLGFYGIK